MGSASGSLLPRNADRTPVSRYSALESWVHQLVASAGKDRFDLNPPAHGASVYRRAALDAIGGFAVRGPGEDVRATAALARAGWRTRFVAEAVAENTVAETVRDYWRQHVRWARNVWAARSAAGMRKPVRLRRPGRRRLELALASLGYADRLAFAGCAMLAMGGRRTWLLPGAYLAVAALEVVVGVAKAGALRRLPAFLWSAALLFPVDVVASAVAGAAHLARRPRTWRTAPGTSARYRSG